MAGEIEVGTVIAGYRIEGMAGRGGMGVVYVAEHVHLGRRVALKVLAPELAADASFRERFIRESQLAAAVEHPNAIPVYDAGEADGVLYIAMRWWRGPTCGRSSMATAGSSRSGRSPSSARWRGRSTPRTATVSSTAT